MVLYRLSKSCLTTDFSSMAILNFYTCTIQKRYPVGRQDNDGDMTLERERWTEPILCEFQERSGEATIADNGDGKLIKYSATIYLRPSCPDFQADDIVKVFIDRKRTKKYVVKGFVRRELQCKLYV